MGKHHAVSMRVSTSHQDTASDLVRWKVNLISLKDGFDLATLSGRLMANFLAGVAAYETEVRAERILAGQAAARTRGARCGGSRPRHRLSVTAEQIACIHRPRSEGKGIAVIDGSTGLSRPTVYRILGERSSSSTSNGA
jgi:DNA invertase Pin-like site-specific DNA recombinase